MTPSIRFLVARELAAVGRRAEALIAVQICMRASPEQLARAPRSDASSPALPPRRRGTPDATSPVARSPRCAPVTDRRKIAGVKAPRMIPARGISPFDHHDARSGPNSCERESDQAVLEPAAHEGVVGVHGTFDARPCMGLREVGKNVHRSNLNSATPNPANTVPNTNSATNDGAISASPVPSRTRTA